MRRTGHIDAAKLGVIGIAVASLLPTAALADKTCNGFINLDCNSNDPLPPPAPMRAPSWSTRATPPSRPIAASPGTRTSPVAAPGSISSSSRRVRISTSPPTPPPSRGSASSDSTSRCSGSAPTRHRTRRRSWSGTTSRSVKRRAAVGQLPDELDHHAVPAPLQLLRGPARQHARRDRPQPDRSLRLDDGVGDRGQAHLRPDRQEQRGSDRRRGAGPPDRVHRGHHRRQLLEAEERACRNQFGNLELDIVVPVLLLEPSSKSLTPQPPPPLPATDVPQFQCYKTTNVTGDKNITNINVKDQFTNPFGGVTLDVDKRGPFRLCVPVNKNGEDPSAPSNPNALLCYKTQDDKLLFSQKTAFITNQFGSFQDTFTQYDELCVPPTILP